MHKSNPPWIIDHLIHNKCIQAYYLHLFRIRLEQVIYKCVRRIGSDALKYVNISVLRF